MKTYWVEYLIFADGCGLIGNGSSVVSTDHFSIEFMQLLRQDILNKMKSDKSQIPNLQITITLIHELDD